MKRIRIFAFLTLCVAILNSFSVVITGGAAADLTATETVAADGKWRCPVDSVDIEDKSELVAQMTVYEENESWDYSDFYSVLHQMPDEVLELFIEEEWSISFGDTSVNYYNLTHGTRAAGLTYPKSHKIFVARTESVAHELGHFVTVNNKAIEAAKSSLFADEAGAALDFLTRYEATTSANEYVAGYFAFLITHQGHSECLAALAEATPETYAFFNGLANDGWVDHEPVSDSDDDNAQHFKVDAGLSETHRGSCSPLAQVQRLRFISWSNK